jgi:phosphoadenosine phosphosulfate reductase
MELQELKDKLSGKSIEDQLKKLSGIFPGKIVFTTSFGIEDQVLSHIIFENNLAVDVVTLDTGRLFPETYKVFSETFNKYNKKIKVHLPDLSSLEKMLSEKGPFSFYNSKENRLECCRLRKIIPLNRALEGKECWVSGIRSGQSDSRSMMDWIEYDHDRNLFKFYPLFDWSFEDIRKFVKENYVPYNVLHDKGFVSIGCEPCTRAVKEGADFRSGRWWWEKNSSKECGLHT